jgi:hypothetical protein
MGGCPFAYAEKIDAAPQHFKGFFCGAAKSFSG